jgi:acetyl-CoA carboxylase biotin carboxylase subunit
MPWENKFKRVLVANRGEIAIRVMRSLHELGLESVAVYSDADAESLHRHFANYALCLPGVSSSETYLNIPLIMQAIKLSGAQAVHPGYGFLSESAEFAKALDSAGIKLIGPSLNALSAMGDKITAKKIMRENNIPVVPGSEVAAESFAALKADAKAIGYPLIIKAAAGGGGRGMRIVRSDAELQAAYEACVREAQSYFGNPQVFCERYIDNPRHIEFQVLFDEHGSGVHLFERDCSIQRRHQKLFEEAPSLYLNAEHRAKLGAIAVAAAKAVNYSGVGTVEFICNSPDEAYFMEMNTRIQVEHPVTEMITGLDLIREQILVAQGQRLSFEQKDIVCHGYALEARINAEDVASGFVPDPGCVEYLQLPGGPFVRVDTHVYQGYKIPQYYDSLLAKLIVWGKDRNTAILRMQRCLQEMRFFGVATTLGFHEWLLQHPRFVAGDFTTNFLLQEEANLLEFLNGEKETSNDSTKTAAILAVAHSEADKSASSRVAHDGNKSGLQDAHSQKPKLWRLGGIMESTGAQTFLGRE